MSKKRKKTFLSLGLITSSFLPLTFLMSNDPNTPTQPGPNEKPEPPKEVSKNFNTFAGIVDAEIKSGLRNALNFAVKALEEEKNKAETVEKDFKVKMQKSYYIQTIINFIKTNQEQIINNPRNFGFNIVYPYALGNNRENNRGKINYLGKEYVDILFGNDSKTSYKDFLTEKDKVEITNNKEKNIITEKELKESIKTYNQNLEKDILKILYNKEEVPEIDEKEFFNFQDLEKKGKKVNGLTFEPPKGFETWDKYITSKISPRYVQFDLEQNKEISEKEKEPPKKPDLPKPPVIEDIKEGLLPDDEFTPIDEKEIIKKVAHLEPQLIYKHVGKNIDQLVNEFKANPTSSDMFFFNNPVNTRYLYKVIELSKAPDQKLKAIVEISDQNDKNLSRRYFIYLEEQNSKVFQKVFQTQIKALEKMYLDFYKSLGLDSKINYHDLKDDGLQNALYSMVSAGSDIIKNEEFVKWQTDFLNFYSEKMNKSNKNIEDIDLQEVENDIKIYFLKILKKSQIRESDTYRTHFYWDAIVEQFSDIARRSEEQIRGYKDRIIKKFQNNGKSPKIVSDLLFKTKKDIFEMQAITNFNSLNLLAWYQKFLSKLTLIKEEARILSEFLKDDQTTFEAKNSKIIAMNGETNKENDTKTKFIKNFNDAEEIIKKQYESQNLFQTIFGSILGAIGLIKLIGFVSLRFIKHKNKTKAIIGIYTLMIVLAAIFAVAGITLLILGIGGF